MDSIQLMIEEHRVIKRMLKVIRKACLLIFNGNPIDYNDFNQMIDFVRNYADAHHHGKEEKFLFVEMEKNLGEMGKKLIRNGMLVEHDLGRLDISELKAALERVKAGDEESKLDVISYAISYSHLLERHIDKEDNVVYTFARKELASSVLEKIEHLTIAFEKAQEEDGVQKKYLGLLEALEKKYKI